MTSLNIFSIPTDIAGLTTATTLYTDGDVLGTQPMSWNVGFNEGIITNAILINATVNLGAVDLFLYDQTVTSAANNAAHAISDADRKLELDVIQFPFPISDTNGQRSPINSVGIGFKCTGAATTLFGILVTRSTHTVHFGAATDITVRLTGSGDA